MGGLKQIPNFLGYYADIQGNIWSKRGNGTKGVYDGKLRKLNPVVNSNGRLNVKLRKEGRTYTRLVYHLILETFIGPCPNGMECCHKNDMKTDNRLENLYWGTRFENMQDAIRNGRTPIGGKNRQSKLTEDDIERIKELYNKDMWIEKDIAKLFDISRTTVNLIINGKRWKHLK